VAQRLIQFAQTEIRPLLGAEATETIIAAHQRRLTLLENALQALSLQYPVFASWLQESYLGRMARALERLRYRDMLSQFLISNEVYADLIKQNEQRWSHVDERPSLDIALSADDLIKRVPLFEGLSADSLKAIGKLLKPRLALPDQRVNIQLGRTRAMYFVASGAVSLALPDGTTAELGSGEFFGEIALLSGKDFATEATSLGYSRLLRLLARDFNALLARDAVLREKIEKVAKQRLRALEVWQEFQSGKRQYEPLPARPEEEAASGRTMPEEESIDDRAIDAGPGTTAAT